MKKISKILILLCAMFFAVSKSNAQLNISISVDLAPPALPVYVQPACPTDGYLWVPGYWAYDNDGGYYWVPGVWVAAPQPGYLWTPAYWGYEGGHYGFHAGYWGPHVGFYGGINYGYGYGGVGFGGGRWEGGNFRYNTAVVNVNTTVVRNTYIDRTVIVNTTVENHTSFNGPGGVTARPRPEEQAAMREQHIQATNEQLSHQQVARKDPNQFAKVNNGHPAAAAMNKVGGRPFDEHGKVSATSTLGHNNPEANKPAAKNEGLPGSADKPVNKAATAPQNARQNTTPQKQNVHAPAKQQVRLQGTAQRPQPKPRNNPKPQPKHEKQEKGLSN